MKNHSFHKSTYIKPESPKEIVVSKEFGGSEHNGDKNEFSSERRNEFADDEGVLRVSENPRKDKKKKLKKMAYLFASTVSVVMLATAALPETTKADQTAVTPTVAPTPVVEEDEFPKLKNLDPDWDGDYAWNQYHLSEYYIIITDKSGVQHPIITGEIYDYAEENYAGASYDKKTNTLTINNLDAYLIDVNLMGNGFKLKLEGENKLDFLQVYGAYYGGSLTITGEGSLSVSGNNTRNMGILLNAEQSETCLMIEKGVTLDVQGQKAVVVGTTLMKEGIYYSNSLEMTGGKEGSGEFLPLEYYETDPDTGELVDTKMISVNEMSELQGVKLYDHSIVGSDGQPSDHVSFKPKNSVTPDAEPTKTAEDTLDDWEITTPYYERWSLEEDALMCAVTVYNDSFGDDGKNLVVADLNDYGTPSTIYIDLPAPIPQDNFVFLGYVVYGGYETMPDGTKLAQRAFPVKDNNIDLYELCRVSTRPEDVEVHAAWRYDLKSGEEPSDYVLVLHANTGEFTDEGHAGLTSVKYEAKTPLGSGSVIYPFAYPAPEKEGYMFAGWYMKDSDDPCYMLQAADFIEWEEDEDGEMHPDWSKKHEIHLYAKWRKT